MTWQCIGDMSAGVVMTCCWQCLCHYPDITRHHQQHADMSPPCCDIIESRFVLVVAAITEVLWWPWLVITHTKLIINIIMHINNILIILFIIINLVVVCRRCRHHRAFILLLMSSSWPLSSNNDNTNIIIITINFYRDRVIIIHPYSNFIPFVVIIVILIIILSASIVPVA